MKSAIVALLTLTSLNAFAARTGTDERIYVCKSAADAKYLGKSEKYRVHVTAKKEIKLTRLSDKKWFKAVPNFSSYYVFYKSNEADYLFPDGQGGYMGDVNAKGVLDIAFQKTPGTYEGDDLQCKLVKVVSQYEPLTATEKALIKIGDDANLANGSYEYSRIDLAKVDYEKEKKAMMKDAKRWDGCSWSFTPNKEAALYAIKKDADDAKAARRLQALDKSLGLVEVIGLLSDNDVSCSNRWFWIYTKDGHRLELYFNQGD